jgi:hypothetical protein
MAANAIANDIDCSLDSIKYFAERADVADKIMIASIKVKNGTYGSGSM